MDSTKLLANAQAAVVSLVDDKLGDEETMFTFAEASKIAEDVGIHVSTIVKLAKEAGLDYAGREVPKEVRGFHANSHDRWYGKGSSATHGGSGWEQISGFSGQTG